MTEIFTIYCHTHIVTGRKYVGQTSKTMEARWKEHVWSAFNHKKKRTYFWDAIRKYGTDAFAHEVLEQVTTREESNAAEMKWIHYLRTQTPHGFNIEIGGGIAPRSDVSRQKASESLRRVFAKKTPEQRREVARKAHAALTPEQRSERAKKGAAHPNRQQYYVKLRADCTSSTREERSARGREAMLRFTPEQRSEMARNRRVLQTPEAKTKRQEKAKRTWETRRARHGGTGRRKGSMFIPAIGTRFRFSHGRKIYRVWEFIESTDELGDRHTLRLVEEAGFGTDLAAGVGLEIRVEDAWFTEKRTKNAQYRNQLISGERRGARKRRGRFVRKDVDG